MSSEVSTAGAGQDLGRVVVELERELAEAHRREAATAEILRVIGSCLSNAQPVFEAIARNAVLLCNAMWGGVFSFDGTLSHFMAGYGFSEDALRHLRDEYPIAPRGVIRLAIMDRAAVHVVDALNDPRVANLELTRRLGYRSHLVVPMLQAGRAIGTIHVYGAQPKPFSDAQISLLQTFADQAVIAIENTRLFEAVQQKNNALTDANAQLTETLEQQTATSEILRVISGSPTDVQPVFDAIAQSAAQLCEAQFCNVFRFDGELVHFAASYGTSPEAREEIIRLTPLRPNRSFAAARAILSNAVVEIPDIYADADYAHRDIARAAAFHSTVAVPMRKDGLPVGAIAVVRSQVGKFPERQVELLKTFADQAVIAIENTRLFEQVQARTRELRESLEYQTAISEVLDVISRSPNELRPVLDVIAKTASRLCEADYSLFFESRDDAFVVTACNDADELVIKYFNEHPLTPNRGSTVGRACVDRRTVHIPDTLADPEFESFDRQSVSNTRTGLAVPLLRDGNAIGVIFVGRKKVRPFSKRQVDLVTTFADQALIAINNVRLFEEVQARTSELAESLEYQTATSDVLNVISRSPSQLQPVFDFIARSASRLCGNEYAIVTRYDGAQVHLVAQHNPRPGASEEVASFYPVAAARSGFVSVRAIVTAAVVHVPDIEAEEFARPSLERYRRIAARALLSVPMMHQGLPIGSISVSRATPGPFSKRQIDLLQTFADQAVIAIENTRLFEEVQARTRELTEALEYRTATSDVLNVISRSPTDVQPVFDMIAESAARLCEAQYCFVYRFDGQLLHFVAHHGLTAEVLEINQRAYPAPPGRTSVAARAVLERSVVQIPDVNADSDYALGVMAAAGGYSSAVAVPILRHGLPIGSIAVTRAQAGLLPDRQIELLQTFADQAVIAIENTRLFEEVQARTREVTEALEQQTATSEILRVISSSPTDVQPVFDAIASTAARLCEAFDAIVLRVDGDLLRLVAHHGAMPAGDVPLHRGTLGGRTVMERQMFHIEDLQAESAEFPEGSAIARERGHRSTLSVPLLREGAAIGNIQVRRNEVRLFTDKQIELLQTFADQAVIAIENTRLFEAEQTRTRELSEALEYQTATSEVLGVISRSPNELNPVFETIARTARRLCQAERASIFRLEDGAYRLVTVDGARQAALEEQLAQVRLVPGGDSIAGRVAVGRCAVHVLDMQADPDLKKGNDARGVSIIGRTMLGVPLLSRGTVVGIIILARSEVRPFVQRQIDLVSTFADQAVIAIENTRLFEAEQARTRELQEALEYQTATSQVLSVISTSPNDLRPVYATILQSVTRLCESNIASLFLYDGQMLRAAAHQGATPEFAAQLDSLRFPPSRDTPTRRAALEGRVVHVPDLLADPEWGPTPAHRIESPRTCLSVPMLREGNLVGVITTWRREVRPFSKRQIELVETFADQAVIAIENTRLFEAVQARTRELTEALEQQTATADVLSVISSSPGELEPVFRAMLANAVRICEAKFGTLFLRDADAFRTVATHNAPPAFVEAVTRDPLFRPPPDVPLGLAAITKQVAQGDLEATQSYIERHPFVVNAVELGGYRTALAVPMLKDNELIGSINILRQEVRPFTDKQIELVKSFANQAVIAIENTRLLNELRESLQQQTATADVLKVISRSPTDLQRVLDTIVETAQRLSNSYDAAIVLREGQGLKVRAHNGPIPMRTEWPTLNRGSVAARSVLDRKTVHVADLASAGAEFPEGQVYAIQLGHRTIIAVPLMHIGEAIGTLIVRRKEVRPFTDKEGELLKTFADQAVIAIENTRLFEEVEARNRDLTALGEVGRAVSSTLDLKVVLKTIVDRAVELSGTDAGSIFYYREETGAFELGETSGLDDEIVARFRKLDISAGQTGLGEAIAKRQPLQVPDVTKRASNPLRDAALEAGLRAALIVPLLGAEGPLGALVLQRRRPGEFPEAVVSLMQTFADQSAIALENARLFEEIARKGRELEIASQHKSQFVANMSHELRTPLAAILGYAELMQEGFYGALSEKSTDALTRIRSNGKHLLGLINTVLDIAKIEAGQFSLSLAEYALDSVVETVRVATESLAETKKLSLKTEVGKRMPIGLGDEQRLTQVLLNLVGNAIKFTDTGEVRISAGAKDGHFVVAVTDTGPGIPDEELKRVFEQFHQVDSSNTKAKGGTGLGLAIAKQIVEMHGGRIWVESILGKGATFQMQLPIRAEFRKGTA